MALPGWYFYTPCPACLRATLLGYHFLCCFSAICGRTDQRCTKYLTHAPSSSPIHVLLLLLLQTQQQKKLTNRKGHDQSVSLSLSWSIASVVRCPRRSYQFLRHGQLLMDLTVKMMFNLSNKKYIEWPFKNENEPPINNSLPTTCFSDYLLFLGMRKVCHTLLSKYLVAEHR